MRRITASLAFLLCVSLLTPAWAQAPQREVRSYPLKAEQLEPMAERIRRLDNVQVGVDHRTNNLIVVATPEGHLSVTGVLYEQPGQQPVRTEPMLADGASHQLKNITWQELEQNLKKYWGSRLTMSVEQDGTSTVKARIGEQESAVMRINRNTGYVVFEAQDVWKTSWRDFVRAVDNQTGGGNPGGATSVVALRKAEPSKVSKAVALLQSAGRAVGGVAVARVSPLAAGPNTLGMVLQGPQPPAGDDQDPDDTAQPPAAPQDGDPQDPLTGDDDFDRPIGDVQLQFIPELNIVVVKGTPRDIARIRRIIDEIAETSKTVQPEIELLPLEHISSQAVQELIVGLYDEVFGPRQGPLTITALDKPNSLLLIGGATSIEVVKELVAKLDQPVPPATQLKVFHLKHISSVDAERTIREFFTKLPGEGGGTGQVDEDRLRLNLGTRVRVISDFRSNSLVVQAAPRDMAEVAHLIQQIDVPSAAAATELRVFRLKNALAADLAPVLIEAITGIGQQQQDQQQQAGGTALQLTKPSTQLTIIGVDAAGNKIIDSGILTDITITADPNVNALVVRAPSSSMELISELVRQLDQLPDAQAQIKVFQIENGDATSLTQMLQLLFGLQVTAGQGVANQALQQLGANFGTAASGESSLVPLNFTVDVRTNSIIASGSASDLKVVEVLLLRLDEEDIEARKTVVYRLQHAPALDVANSIDTFLLRQQQINQLTVQTAAVSPFEQIEREVIVVPELVSNSLIVSATPRYFDQILRVIRELDFRKPMVMVQVVIAEVALTDTFEFGVELGLQDSLIYDRSVFTGDSAVTGFNFNNTNLPLPNSSSAQSMATREDLAGQALSALGLGRQSGNLGYGGMVLSAANESISVLVRALQDAGRMQVLSRPQVMTLDNQPAFVQVGARVPRITGSTITNGIVQNNTVDEDVGLLLRIQPRINENGLVVMTIDAENSEVGPISEGIPVAVDATGAPVLSPQIETTTAQTTISAHSGQTVVFAGLITKNRMINSRRVPYLSDVPIVGQLFRFDQESEQRSELLIFMTPYIVDEKQDYDWLKQVESQRMSWCLADVIEMHGNVGLSGGHGLWGPAAAPIIYPDDQPTADMLHPIAVDHGQGLPGEWMRPYPATGAAVEPAPAGAATPAVPMTPIEPNVAPEPPLVAPMSAAEPSNASGVEPVPFTTPAALQPTPAGPRLDASAQRNWAPNGVARVQYTPQATPAASYQTPAPASPAAYAAPAYQAPAYQPPRYGQPAYGAAGTTSRPAYGQPVYGQPSYGQPSNGQPSYGQPAYGQPSAAATR